jgi:hypothetical protein
MRISHANKVSSEIFLGVLENAEKACLIQLALSREILFLVYPIL